MRFFSNNFPFEFLSIFILETFEFASRVLLLLLEQTKKKEKNYMAKMPKVTENVVFSMGI